VPPPSSQEIDHILDAIRSEARARGSKGRVGAYSTELPAGSTVQVASYGLLPVKAVHVADFLALPLDVFLEGAYRHILGRDPDTAGAAHYQRALLRGRLTRIEVLGRLGFSSEARKRGSALPGLAIAFMLASGYRVPIVGPLAAWLARLLRLPAHWQDRSTLEAAALATGHWMKR
jgi:O-antigen chain-terminating methyltransferase